MKILIVSKIIFVILWVFIAAACGGIDLGSFRLSILVATHYATLHRPATTPNTEQFMRKHRILLDIFA